MTSAARAASGASGAGARIAMVTHADEAALVEQVSQSIVAAIAADLQVEPEILVLLSGGSTPVPVYEALAARMPAAPGVTVSLVDDRWVAPDAAGSNARMVRDTLLARAFAGARFWPLVQWESGLAQSAAGANARLRDLAAPPAVVVLGMGEDGHTASLFPGSADLPAALRSAEPYVAFDASGCAGAGSWPQRITLTPAGWMRARRRLLLIRGRSKRQVIERAMQAGDPLALPVYAALAVGDAPLQVHWCP